jgi:hypothetical protein
MIYALRNHAVISDIGSMVTNGGLPSDVVGLGRQGFVPHDETWLLRANDPAASNARTCLHGRGTICHLEPRSEAKMSMLNDMTASAEDTYCAVLCCAVKMFVHFFAMSRFFEASIDMLQYSSHTIDFATRNVW